MARGDAGVVLALVQRLGVSSGGLFAGLGEAVANGPPVWLHMLRDVPRGSSGVGLLVRWRARSLSVG